MGEIGEADRTVARGDTRVAQASNPAPAKAPPTDAASAEIKPGLWEKTIRDDFARVRTDMADIQAANKASSGKPLTAKQAAANAKFLEDRAQLYRDVDELLSTSFGDPRKRGEILKNDLLISSSATPILDRAILTGAIDDAVVNAATHRAEDLLSIPSFKEMPPSTQIKIIYSQQPSLDVRKALEANPKFRKIVAEAAGSYVNLNFDNSSDIETNNKLFGIFVSDVKKFRDDGHNSLAIMFLTSAVEKYQEFAKFNNTLAGYDKIFANDKTFQQAIERLKNCFKDSKGQLPSDINNLIKKLEALAK